MSTKSVIAVPTDEDWYNDAIIAVTNDVASAIVTPSETGWKGRYVHWDGYPSHMIPTLEDLIAKKGFQRTVDVLINWNPAWSFIGYNQGIIVDPSLYHWVSDYGVAYRREFASMDDWITSENVDPIWIEYVYILDPKGIVVLESKHDDENGYHFVQTYDYMIGA